MKDCSSYFSVVTPTYPNTNAVGSVIGPGTEPTLVLRIRGEDFIFDVNLADLRASRVLPSAFSLAAEELGVTRHELRKQAIAFAKAQS